MKYMLDQLIIMNVYTAVKSNLCIVDKLNLFQHVATALQRVYGHRQCQSRANAQIETQWRRDMRD